MPAALNDALMDAGFRRSGSIVYLPVCSGCRECVPIRVPVNRFTPDKSQRRCFGKNSDLVVTVGLPELSDEKVDLYHRYVTQWHGRAGESAEQPDRESLEQFLYQSPVDTLEFCYRTPAGQLIGVGITDVSPRVLSSVYFYFDPEASRRGIGTFGALYELDWAKKHGIEFYYLGFYIRDCDKMNYKARFRPSQLLGEDGSWLEIM